MDNAKIGAAVLGGYLLGRTKNAKLAIGLGALLAGSRVRPGQFGKALDSPFLNDITRQLRTELTDASRAAATSVLTTKADHLADALHDRTAGLREQTPKPTQEEGEPEKETEPEEEARTEAEPEEEAPRPRKKTTAASPSRSRRAAPKARRQGDG
ncbi:hypothetical protein [Streptomyces sp. NPDC057877]|uniref:hypothetical protein n=1 Tax=Streptomyces sp. NPDC057877 TaxID=3346269 RepID=UPI0036AF196E